MIVGPNGHGKTSLLEALLYPEVFRSFRGAADRELVPFGRDGFWLSTSAGRGTVTVGYDARTRQKKVTIDGAEVSRLADAIGRVQGVVLSPTDVALVAGGPRERRRYLDVLLAVTVPGYVESLARYRRALAQRMRCRPADMAPFEHVLADAGAALVAARAAWAGRWSDRFAEYAAAIGEQRPVRLAYAPRTPGGAPELAAAFAAARERDRSLGRATAGPHRDDLKLALGGRLLRAYGSAGQQRTAALALRLLAVATIQAAGGGALLCLDDAFAELDADRSHRLGALIAREAAAGSRIVAAIPKLTDLPDVIGDLPRWEIRDGRVTA